MNLPLSMFSILSRFPPLLLKLNNLVKLGHPIEDMFSFCIVIFGEKD